MTLTLNFDYFPARNYAVDLCNDEVLCSVWGTVWIIKYLDELRFQRVDFILRNQGFSDRVAVEWKKDSGWGEKDFDWDSERVSDFNKLIYEYSVQPCKLIR
jgi:hypothetical protein